MKLVLPTGDDGVERSYPLDDILDLSQVSLTTVIDLKRATGQDLNQLQRGLALLDRVVGIPNSAVLQVMSESLEAMEAWRALVWLARYSAGDRAEDGRPLTAEQAVEFPFDGIQIVPEASDLAPSEGPQSPSTDGGRLPGGVSPNPGPTPEIFA